jgi:hypothetical protein
LPKLFTIDDQWTPQPWYSTGGTRAKKYLLGPDGRFYYFKRSQYKPGKDYTYEFWNEVIAYDLGTSLGFNMLRYDIAIDGDLMGCISEKMINSESEELIEGVKYLQAYSPNYDPSKKEHQTWYTFDLIKNALESAKIGKFIDNVLEVIVFDALIGNSDRHQENWAVIARQRLIPQLIEEMEKRGLFRGVEKHIFPRSGRLIKELIDDYTSKGEKIPRAFYQTEPIFAPIYDSGSSLGRELLPPRVDQFITSEKDLKQYIEKGVSEIHWQNKKLTHFELIRNLLNTPHGERLRSIIKRVSDKFDGREIAARIESVDLEVPDNLGHFRIPEARKRLIIKIITLRFEKLGSLINEGF